MDTMLAALPIVVVLILMTGLKWSAIWAELAAAALAVVLALTVFGFGTEEGFGRVLALTVARLVGTLVPTVGPPWRWMAIAYAAFFIPYLLIARSVGPELPSLLGAIVGAGVFIAWVRLAMRRRAGTQVTASAPSGAPGLSEAEVAAEHEVEHAADAAERTEAHLLSLLAVTAPYAILVTLVLLTRLMPPVKGASQS